MLKTLWHAIKPVARPLIDRAGADIVPIRSSVRGDIVMRRVAALSGAVQSIIDIGASDGQWSRAALQAFPGADALLIEAQETHRPALDRFVAGQPGVSYVLAAASDHDGSIFFLDNGDYGGAALRKGGPGTIEVPCVSVDSAVASRGLTGPFLLKLDTHGHEVEILDGAARTLQDTSVVVIEAYTFANNGRLVFYELCEHMAGKGFRPAGIGDVMSRPGDELLWQMDIWFLRSDNACFKDTRYEAAFPKAA